jgi:cob(I)alamin adenosyltransferase
LECGSLLPLWSGEFARRLAGAPVHGQQAGLGENGSKLPRSRTRSSEVSLPETRKGLIIVYTGPGKGKTTAALGTMLRCVGQGMKALMVQFIKGSWHYGELEAGHLLGEERFKILPMGRGFVKVGAEKPDPEDIRLVQEAWEFARANILEGQYDLVVLDEINYAISYKMLDAGVVVEALKKKPETLHVILTGRNAHPEIVDLADLVTEMREVKHPYQKGILAQKGIEY